MGRFFSSLRPGGPPPAELEWAKGYLSSSEQALLLRMSGPDRRHAVDVARRVEPELSSVPVERQQAVMAAALLHDVGKTEANLGTYGRAIATASGVVGGLDLAAHWQEKSGFTRKVGLYLQYGTIGADMLRLAGSDEWVVAWSEQHHLGEDAWTIPVEVGRLLVAADR
jgi:hypothetical protein